MRVTQVQIAAAVGLDVSSVNKILNGVPGPIFRKETRARVLLAAKRLGYQRNRASRWELVHALRNLSRAVLAMNDDDEETLRDIPELAAAVFLLKSFPGAKPTLDHGRPQDPQVAPATPEGSAR